MNKPPYLVAGDRVRIVSPSGKVKEEKILPGVELLKQAGFEVVLGEHVFYNYFQFAGTDEQRLQDLQQALDDPGCKAIICSRGGYGAVRIADQLGFSAFCKKPKWLVGFSDITVFHAQVQKEGICSVHGAMPGFYLQEGNPSESFTKLVRLLKGEGLTVQVPPHPLNRAGKAQGELVGGNLSILYSLLGTAYEPSTDGKILFIEDLSEYLYFLDRMMHSLKLAGKLSNLKRLVVGGFTDMKDNDSPFGQTALEIIHEAVKDFDYPVCFDFPAGHIDRNLPLVFGGQYTFDVTDEQVSLGI